VKVIDVVKFIASEGEIVEVKRLAEELGIPVSQVRRVLCFLKKCGYVEVRKGMVHLTDSGDAVLGSIAVELDEVAKLIKWLRNYVYL